MAFSIKHPEADRLVRELCAITDEKITDAVIIALRERLERERRKREKEALVAEMMRLADELSKLPVLDPRSPDEILGYDEHGLPT